MVYRTHGHTKGTEHGRHSPTYNTWRSMKQRCSPRGHYYDKGIRVCAEWALDFPRFLADMGERPDGHTLDRIDNELGYEPGNCRWATPEVQHANKRSPAGRTCKAGCTCGRHVSRPMSPETKAKLSAAKMGHEVSMETRVKIIATKRARGLMVGSRKCEPGCGCRRHEAKGRPRVQLGDVQ